jgi:hypothetical protein
MSDQQVNAVPALVLSIVVTVLCCLPLGVAGIVMSAMAMSAAGTGDFARAENLKKNAMICNYIGLAVGVVIIIIAFVGGFLGAAAEMSAG